MLLLFETKISICEPNNMEPVYRASHTIISDLNDDCIAEVFKYLDLKDLCAVADVCRRFRQNALNHFALPKYKKDILTISCCSCIPLLHLKPRNTWTRLHKSRYIPSKDMSVDETLPQISLFLRVFGRSVKSIYMYDFQSRKQEEHAETQCKCQRIILDRISRYCSGTLIELQLRQFDLTGKNEASMRSLLLQLQKLTIIECKYSKLFGQMLSTWSPELRELHFSHDVIHPSPGRLSSIEMQFDDIFRQSFHKLTSASFRSIKVEKSYDIDEFLKLNPQLKKIGLVNCPSIHGNIFQSLATHVPAIEAIEIDRLFTLNDSTLKYCGKLNCLSTLKLCTMGYWISAPIDHTFILSLLYEIQEARIALQHLHVLNESEQNFERTEQLVDAISRLQTLKTLWLLQIPRLKVSHVFGICEQLTQLSELRLQHNKIMMTADDLLGIIKKAQKLQSLRYTETNTFFEKCKADTLFKKKSLLSYDEYNNFYMKFDPRPHLADRVRADNGLRILLNALSRRGPLSDDVQRILAIHKEFEESLIADEVPKCVDACIKMVQIVRQRRGKTRILIELDTYSPITSKLPKDLIRKHDGILTFVGIETGCPFFFSEFVE